MAEGVSLLVDVFGYASIILHGLTLVAQSMALGGILFIVFLARPFAAQLDNGEVLLRRVTRVTVWSALALAVVDALGNGLQVHLLMETLDLSFGAVMEAGFALASMVKIGCAVLIALFLSSRRRVPALLLLALGAIELTAATTTTHAAARLEDRGLLLAVEGLHQLGAAIWVGGLPAFVVALGQVHDGAGWRLVGARFSRMSMLGVACILVSGVVMTLFYIGSLPAFYGTAYGIMVGAKIALFAGLLGLGAGNFLVTERLRRDPAAPVIRMKRFAEVEIGIGFSIFFAAASLTSLPPAIDLPQDRVTLQDIAERNRPAWPRLTSPDHDALALPALQEKLDREAAAEQTSAAAAFVPGAGDLPPRNADDVAWSEYNHHWAGLFVGLVGLLVIAQHAGVRAARHWPIVFLLLGGFLFLRADPEVWPLGTGDFWAAWRDVEVLQHRLFVALIVLFGLVGWAVQTGRLRSPRAALVFPVIVAVGGALLLTHSHQIVNVKDATLIELTHTPLALLGIAAGWAAWLELRLPGRAGRVAGWSWGICFVLVGVVLLWYREA